MISADMKNDSLIGPYRISRGRNVAKDLGKIKMFEDKEKLDVWPVNSTCNNILGTDSTIFPPFLQKTDPIYIYVPEVCGSLYAEFDLELNVGNVDVLKYTGSKKNFADPLKYSPNKCHCTGVERFQSIETVPEKYLVCPKEGAMFLQMCHKAPIVFSKPHFYSADSEYIDFVKGLKPNQQNHETYVHIEPISGTPVEGHKRLQMNMYLHNFSQILILNNVSSGLMPLLWIEEGFKLRDEHMSLLVTFYHLLTALNVFPCFLILCGIVLIGVAAFLVVSSNTTIFNIGRFSNIVSSVQNHVAENGGYTNDNMKTLSDESASTNKNNASTTLNEYRNYNCENLEK